MNTDIPAGRENPPTKEPPTGKNPSTTREPTQTKETATLEHPDKEIKETTPLNPTEFLPQKFPTKTASKAKYQEAQKQTKRVT